MTAKQDTLRREVCEANMGLARAGLVVLTWGNVSGRDRRSGRIVIKPSGVSYAKLTPGSMASVGPDGRAAERGLRPSTDTPTHLVLYRAWDRVGGVAHFHSPYAVAFAQACRSIPCLGTTHADHFRGEIPVTRAVTPGEAAENYEIHTGNVILERFSDIDPGEVPGVLVARHGAFTWGKDAGEALERAVVLEEVARMAYLTYRLRANTAPMERYLTDVHHLRKHGAAAYYGQAVRVREHGAGRKKR